MYLMIIWFKIEIDQKKNAATAGVTITYINMYARYPFLMNVVVNRTFYRQLLWD